MKLGPVTKLDDRKKTTSKDDDVMRENYDVNAIFPIPPPTSKRTPKKPTQIRVIEVCNDLLVHGHEHNNL